MVILYREMSIVKMAIPSVSKNLYFFIVKFFGQILGMVKMEAPQLTFFRDRREDLLNGLK